MDQQQKNPESEIEIRDQSGDPFTAVWNWLLDRTDLRVSEKLVWIALKSYAGYREIRPSVQAVAKRASMSVRTAQRSFDVLSKKGFLRIERRSRPDGGFATNRYVLLASSRDKGRGVGDRVTPTPPGVKVTPVPGATMSPPQVTSCHQKENIKQIKDKKPTPLTPLLPDTRSDRQSDPGEKAVSAPPADTSKAAPPVVVFEDVKKMIIGTQFQELPDQVLLNFTKQHGCKLIFDTLDVLTAIYKQNGKQVKDPVAVLITALLRGVTPPYDYAPYHERIKKEQKVREETEKRRIAVEEKTRAEEAAYRRKAEEFDALPEEERNQWLEEARATMHPNLRNAKIATRSIAISLFRGG